jgi:hypothetical protein
MYPFPVFCVTKSASIKGFTDDGGMMIYGLFGGSRFGDRKVETPLLKCQQ